MAKFGRARFPACIAAVQAPAASPYASRWEARMNILVADDDRTLSHLICSLLRDRGHVATAVFDSMQALMVAVRKPSPDLILLDIHMPAGTGLLVLEKLRASPRTASIPVIVITGTVDPEAARRAEALGAVGFLAKPIDPEAFLSLVQRVVGENAAAPGAS
jgi:CheY-like chemotaxis protein